MAVWRAPGLAFLAWPDARRSRIPWMSDGPTPCPSWGTFLGGWSKPFSGPSTDDIMAVQRKTGHCSPRLTHLLAGLVGETPEPGHPGRYGQVPLPEILVAAVADRE